MQKNTFLHPASYRDPSGYIFQQNGIVYRQVNKTYQHHFEHFINSGCYAHLTKHNWLIPHQELKKNMTGDENWFTTLQPEPIAFISYIYEWSFNMLKDAALLTLTICKEA